MREFISRSEVNKSDRELENEYVDEVGMTRDEWFKSEKFLSAKRQGDAWKALQAFYRLKSLLLPSFIQRNKQCLNSIEAELMREWEGGGKK